MSGFGTDGLHDEHGAVNFRDAAALARGEGVTRGGTAGVPVHAVQPDAACGLRRHRGQHRGFPAQVAVAVGGGGGFAQLFGQRLKGQQAEGADGDKYRRLHPERLHQQAAEQGSGTAHGKPDGDEIPGHGFQHHKTDGTQQPEDGVDGNSQRHAHPSFAGFLVLL